MEWGLVQLTNLLVFLLFIFSSTLYDNGGVYAQLQQPPQRTCSAFYNPAGVYIPEFSCDDDVYPYCCGACNNKYCCRDNATIISTDCDEPSLPLSLIAYLGFAVVATLFLMVLILAAGWCCKKCRTGKGVLEESDEEYDRESYSGSSRRIQYTSTRRHGFYAPPTRSSGYSSRRPCPCGSPVLPTHAQYCYHGYMNPMSYTNRSPCGYHGKHPTQTIVLQDF